MINNLNIDIRMTDHGYEYNIYDKDSEKDIAIDGGFCTSNIVSALQMATYQANQILVKERLDKNLANQKFMESLTPEQQDEVLERMSDMQTQDAEDAINGEETWQATDEQYLDWAIEEFEANRD